MAIKELNSENFNNEIADGLSIIDFWAPWCGPCKMMGPVVDELAEDMPEHKFGKVNIDNHQDIALKYNVMSIPTIIIFKDGQPVTSSIGVVSKKALREKIESAL